MTDDSKNQRAPYEADNPVSTPEEDRFGRYPFAKRLAETIAASRVDESLVIGLYAPWGAGKSSVLRFLERELGKSPRILLLSFNPWRYPTEEALLEAFYDDVARTLKRSVKTEKEKRRAKTARIAGTVPEGTTVLGIPVGSVTKAVEGLAREHSEVTVEVAKRRVGQFLQEQGLRVVVLLDDLDRLEASEAHAVLRLVRLNADFPRMTYVITCDAEMVASTLAQRFGGAVDAGRNFLEKIVQIPLSLPPADTLALRSYCLERISRLLVGPDFPSDKSELRRLLEGFDGGVLLGIRTPRMAKRYVNAVEFALPLARGEVNSTDVLLLEALRVLHAPVYEQLLGARECLLGKRGSWDHRDSTTRAAANTVMLDQLLSAIPLPARSGARAIIEAVFPYVRSLRVNVVEPDEREEWRTLRRAAAAEYFDRHFLYGVPDRDLSDVAVAGLVDLLKQEDVPRATEWVRTHVNGENAGLLSTKLAPHLEGLRNGDAARSARALAAIGGLVPDQSEFLLPGAQWFLSGRVALLVRSIGDDAERVAAARGVLADPVRLGFARSCLLAMRPDTGAPQRPEDFDAGTLEELQRGLVARIREAAVAATLHSEPGLSGLLVEWMKVDGGDATRQWAEGVLDTPGLLGSLLGAFAGTSTPMEGGESVPSFSMDTYTTLGKVVGTEAVEGAIRRRFGENLKPIEEWDPASTGLSTEEFLARRFVALHRSKPAASGNEPPSG